VSIEENSSRQAGSEVQSDKADNGPLKY